MTPPPDLPLAVRVGDGNLLRFPARRNKVAEKAVHAVPRALIPAYSLPRHNRSPGTCPSSGRFSIGDPHSMTRNPAAASIMAPRQVRRSLLLADSPAVNGFPA